MELIIKPTGRCNFCCTFCSASELKTSEDTKHVHPKMREYIERAKPSLLIITGGDPLMMDPQYYYELFDIAKVHISATTNLKDFYLNPDKWAPLFNEPWFDVATSFQYGSGRMWDKNTVYTEDIFRKVMNLFRERVNKMLPPFLTVLSEENESRAVDHVLLAKELGTTVKLNAALPVGRQGTWYPRYKLYGIYLDLIDVYHLDMYEANCLDRHTAHCPNNVCNGCNFNIRCCYIGPDDELHVGVCDEMISMGRELHNESEIDCKVAPHALEPTEFIHDRCAYCQLCMLCNGCNLNRTFAKTDPNYCKEMKKLEDRIIATGWAV